MKKMRLNFKKVEASVKRARKFTVPKLQKEKVKKEPEKEPHVNERASKNGCTWRDSSHPYKGYRYMAGVCLEAEVHITAGDSDKRKGLYNEFKFVDQAYGEKYVSLIKDNFKFDHGGANFCTRAEKSGRMASQKYPYNWESHHIIPCAVFGDGEEAIFNDDESQILRAIGYNVNHGHNIIFLPGANALNFVPVHGLIQHLGSHPGYNKTATEEVENISAKVKKSIKKEKQKVEKDAHAKLSTAFIGELRTVEQEMWQKLVDASHKAVGNKLNETGGSEDDYIRPEEKWFQLT